MALSLGSRKAPEEREGLCLSASQVLSAVGSFSKTWAPHYTVGAIGPCSGVHPVPVPSCASPWASSGCSRPVICLAEARDAKESSLDLHALLSACVRQELVKGTRLAALLGTVTLRRALRPGLEVACSGVPSSMKLFPTGSLADIMPFIDPLPHC